MAPTQEQINAWKAAYGEIADVAVRGLAIIARRPTPAETIAQMSDSMDPARKDVANEQFVRSVTLSPDPIAVNAAFQARAFAAGKLSEGIGSMWGADEPVTSRELVDDPPAGVSLDDVKKWSSASEIFEVKIGPEPQAGRDDTRFVAVVKAASKAGVQPFRNAKTSEDKVARLVELSRDSLLFPSAAALDAYSVANPYAPVFLVAKVLEVSGAAETATAKKY